MTKNKTEPENYFIFVDIDGVLVTARNNFMFLENDYQMHTKFDPVCIDLFNYIHMKYYGVHFVLSTSWKAPLNNSDEKEDMGLHKHWVHSAFRSSGFIGNFGKNWKTGYEDTMVFPRNHRIKEINSYLDENPCRDFLIFDDEDLGFKNMHPKRWIKTDEHNGLTWKNIIQAKSIIGTWEDRYGN